MNTSESRRRIAEGEGVFQEFKRSVEKLDRTLVAFANARGGVVLLGVNDDGVFSGLRITNRLKAEVQSIARNTDPPVTISCVDLGQALAVIVKEGDEKPYRCADGFFLRSGAANQKLTRNEILDLAVRLDRLRFEALQVFEFDYPRAFSESTFRAFVERAHLESPLRALGEVRFLVSLGVAEEQAGRLIFNNAGVLFFGADPQKHLVQAKTSYAWYRGQDKTVVVDRVILAGPLMDQMDRALDKLAAHVPMRYQLSGSAGRREIPSYPIRALQEALTNALIHRDYSEVGSETRIDHFDDRIEVSNPGGLLGSLTLESLKSKSRRRNPLLAELFYRIGRGEKLGSGIVRMQALMEEWKLPSPRFDVTADEFSVVFPGPSANLPEEKLLRLSDRQRQFMEAINQIPIPFSAQTYAERFSITLRTAQEDLGALIDKGLIRREGRGKNTTYRFS